jgi:hypothetical protein
VNPDDAVATPEDEVVKRLAESCSFARKDDGSCSQPAVREDEITGDEIVAQTLDKRVVLVGFRSGAYAG